jgi:Ca2+-binding EF-hand superfamily protein
MSEPPSAYNSNNHYGLPSKFAQESYGSFTEFDVNRNGAITIDETKECLRRAGIQFQESDVNNTFQKYMDLNKDGNVSLDEYMKLMAAVFRGERQGFKHPDDK